MAKQRPSSRHKPGPGKGAGTLRIIGGDFRGRRLPIADLDGLRPTGDRQRETLFNWLQFELPGARVADLFAGTGALGLEAASRGAAEVWLIETHPKAARALEQAAGLLRAPVKVARIDALAWLRDRPAASLDGVFVDPPFAADLWQPVLDALTASGCLKAGAFVYLETPRDRALSLPEGWTLAKEKSSGDVTQRLVRLPASPDPA